MIHSNSKKNRAIWIYVIAVCTAAGLVVWVFALASRAARIPPLPRAAFARAEIDRALTRVRSRAQGLELTPKERIIREKLAELHLAETGDFDPPEARAQVEEALGEVKEMAAGAAREHRDRYLLLGDYLAAAFDKALAKVLDQAGRKGLGQRLLAGGSEVKDLEQAGGAFLRRAIERGLITDRGELRAERIVPIVLFKVRWRHLGGLPLDDGLSRVEARAYWDFVAAFAEPSSALKRLEAVDQLKRLDNSYDHVIARAVIFHEAGQDAKARHELTLAMQGGRRDRLVTAFDRALKK